MKYLVILVITFAAAQASLIGLGGLGLGGLGVGGLIAPIGPAAVIKGASSASSSVGLDGVAATAVDGAVVVAPGTRAGLGLGLGTGAVIAGPSGTVITNGVGGLGLGLGLGGTIVRPAIAKSIVVPGILGHGIL